MAKIRYVVSALDQNQFLRSKFEAHPLDAAPRSTQGRRHMTAHDWSTYSCNDYRQQDECLRCDARRVRGVNSKWLWQYRRTGKGAKWEWHDFDCEPVIDPSPQERAVMAEGRDG